MRIPKNLNFFLTLVLLLLGLSLFAQNTDPLSYHTSRQLSDTAYSIKKANGDSTIFLFESSSQQSNINSNLAGIPTYAGQDSAVKHGLKKGDIYKLPTDANNNRLLAIVDTTIVINTPEDTGFFLIVDNSNNNTHLKFRVQGVSNFDMTVNWGDGNIDNYSDSDLYIPDHIYSTASIYHVGFTFNDYSVISDVIIGSDYSPTCNITVFHNAQLFTNLTGLDVEGTAMASWTYFDGLASTLTSSWLSGNKLSSAELNKLLIYFDSLPFNSGPKNLYIYGQQTGDQPTGAGLTALASLQTKGWVISY